MGNDGTFITLGKFLQLHRSQLIFLCETKMTTVQMNNIGKELKLDNCFTVSSSAKSAALRPSHVMEF